MKRGLAFMHCKSAYTGNWCDGGQLADGGDMSQTFCGSKAYAAPEILQGRTYDPMKADVWALGVIIYIFITGKMPFDETKVCPSLTSYKNI